MWRTDTRETLAFFPGCQRAGPPHAPGTRGGPSSLRAGSGPEGVQPAPHVCAEPPRPIELGVPDGHRGRIAVVAAGEELVHVGEHAGPHPPGAPAPDPARHPHVELVALVACREDGVLLPP